MCNECASWFHPAKIVVAVLAGVIALAALARGDGETQVVPKDTQAETTPRVSPQDAADGMKPPPGFKVGVFAAEPMIRQPIAMAFDGRGRLWVAENDTYAEAAVGYDLSQTDRIVILEDTDRDGKADKRTVFKDGLQRLTSVEVGFGGVWVLAAPHLLFFPDANGDDVPDGEPVVLLDGWDGGPVRHNIVNGLKWGPDGWLYGRHGIQATSVVGPPGTPAIDRIALNCCLWRFHPTTHAFEVVCQGGTNSWGHDWDENGELFFINTVIGHLWHAIPGAHYDRMYGEDLTPNVYDLIPQTADHVHWAGGEKWSDAKKDLTGATDAAGGGHAHSGLMIYQGDDWPVEYRGELFTLNFHGRRINREHLERRGATYVGLHRPDFMTVADPWFRGVDLASGPDGGVYVLDWSDIGECHENDGVHRSSGRIYKITYGDPQPVTVDDVAALPDAGLVALQTNANVWYARQARRVLQERSVAGADLSAAKGELRTLFDSAGSVPVKLRALWCLHSIDAAPEPFLLGLMHDPNEHVRTWAVKLLVDAGPPSPAALRAFLDAAQDDESGLVLTFIASALQKMPLADRWPIAAHLVRRPRFADDPVLPRMTWFGIEPAVAAEPEKAGALLAESKMPRVDRSVARRVTSRLDIDPAAADGVVAFARKTNDAAARVAVLDGMSDALRGWSQAPKPGRWDALIASVDGDGEAAKLVRELSVVFGDGRAFDELRAVVGNGGKPADERRRAIRSLATAKDAGLAKRVEPLLFDRDLSPDAVAALAATGEPAAVASKLVAGFGRLPRLGKAAALDALAARPESAAMLLAAVAAGKIAPQEVDPFALRRMQLLGRDDLSKRVAELWPGLQLIAADKLGRIASYRTKLDAAGDPRHGREVFKTSCGKCHKLFGEGETVGPELTGAQRSNLNYWLENVFDPSAQVAADFRMSVVLLTDGRVLNGVLGREGGKTVTLRTPTEVLTLDRNDVEEVKQSNLSLMPEGLLSNLSDKDVQDLFAYLMAPSPPAR